MGDTSRVFVAVPVVGSARASLARLRNRLEHDARGVRWLDERQWHLTLAFLGDVRVADIAEVCRRVGEASAAYAEFELRLTGVGAFPNARRPGVVWAGISGDALPQLYALRESVVAAAISSGYAPDKRFAAHVTLGRVAGRRGAPADLSDALAPYADWKGTSVEINEIVVYSSQLSRDGSNYTPLSRALLGAC